jgi:TRAP-type C4-dicarboxylate transport system permease small subunit
LDPEPDHGTRTGIEGGPKIPGGTLKKIEGALAIYLRWGTIGCFVGLLFLIGAGIFVRFIPFFPIGWADEVIEWAFAWMVFLGTAVLWRKRTHFRVDLIPNWLAGSRAGHLLEIFLSLLSLFFFLVFTYEGWVLTMRTTDPSPILAWPKALWYLVMPISGAFLMGYTIRDLYLLFRGRTSLWIQTDK